MTTRENSSCHSKVTSESVPFRNTLGGFMTKVPQELGQGLCQPIFRSALGKRLLCRKWYHRLFFFFFFPKVFVIAKSMAPAHLGVLENYLFPYNALSNPFLAILALSLRKKDMFFLYLSVVGLECLFQNSLFLERKRGATLASSGLAHC